MSLKTRTYKVSSTSIVSWCGLEPANSQPCSFCYLHRSFASSLKEIFRTHLSLIQTLLSPLTNLHARCSSLARTHLTHNPRHKSPPSSPPPSPLRLQAIDLELAFRGPSRDAFSWLSVVLVSEPTWAHPSPNACPACLTLQSFTGEPYLRILVAASRLWGHFLGREDTSKPSLDLVTPVLQSAITEDEFWGPRGWEEISARAGDFETGIIQLLAQCKELEAKYPADMRDQPATSVGSATIATSTIAPATAATDFFASSVPAAEPILDLERKVSAVGPPSPPPPPIEKALPLPVPVPVLCTASS